MLTTLTSHGGYRCLVQVAIPHIHLYHILTRQFNRHLCLCLLAPGTVVLSPGCSSLGESCMLLLLEHPSCRFPVALPESLSDSRLFCSMTRCLFCLCGDFVTSSHISIPSRGGIGQHDQLPHSGSSHSSESDEYDFQLSVSVSSPVGWLRIGLGDCTFGGTALELGHGKMFLKSFADSSSAAMRDNEMPLIGTHSIRLVAGS